MNHIRLVSSTLLTPAAEDTSRRVTAILNTQDVGLDNHIVITRGIDTSAYDRNGRPVLFAHKQDEPSVGKITAIETRGTVMLGQIQFADADAYPFADTVYKLIRGGFLNSTSISWSGVEWERANDPARPGGINFTKSLLLETSIVPVPANPGAIITARAAGVDTKPLFDWAERVLDTGGLAMVPREELEALRRDARPLFSARAESKDPPVTEAERAESLTAQDALAALKERLPSVIDDLINGTIAALKAHKPALPAANVAIAEKTLTGLGAEAKKALGAIDVERSFNPDQPRDPDGKFGGGGGSADEAKTKPSGVKGPKSGDVELNKAVNHLIAGGIVIAAGALATAIAPEAAVATSIALASHALGFHLLITSVPDIATHLMGSLGVHVDVANEVLGHIKTAIGHVVGAASGAAPGRSMNVTRESASHEGLAAWLPPAGEIELSARANVIELLIPATQERTRIGKATGRMAKQRKQRNGDPDQPRDADGRFASGEGEDGHDEGEHEEDDHFHEDDESNYQDTDQKKFDKHKAAYDQHVADIKAAHAKLTQTIADAKKANADLGKSAGKAETHLDAMSEIREEYGQEPYDHYKSVSGVAEEAHGNSKDALGALSDGLKGLTKSVGQNETRKRSIGGSGAGVIEDRASTFRLGEPLDLKRAAFDALRRLDEGALHGVYTAMRKHLEGVTVVIDVSGKGFEPLVRAGRVLSAKNEEYLRAAHVHMARAAEHVLAAHGHVKQAADTVGSVVDQADPDPDPESDATAQADADAQSGEDEERALRERKARALARKLRAV